MTPSMPVIVLNVTVPNRTGLPVNSLIVNMKNSIAKLMNTNCKARLAFNVHKNIAKVKIPHIRKYAAIAVSVGALSPVKNVTLGRTRRMTRDHQKKP
jgi:hypothetical protein